MIARSRLLMMAIMFTSLAGLFVGCAADETDSDADSVEIVLAERGPMTVSITAVGSASPRAEAVLSFGIGGGVSEIAVEAGERVQTGQELVRLDTSDLELQVKSAEAALAAAQAQLDQLVTGARPEDIAIAQSNLDTAEARLDGAEANLRALKKGPNKNEVAAAESNVKAAEAAALMAAMQRDQLTEGPSSAAIASAQAQLRSAEAQQKIALDAHDETMKCHEVRTPEGKEKTVCPALGTLEEQARFTLQAADESVSAAQAQYNQLFSGPGQKEYEAASANVSVAEAQRDAAQAQLDLLKAGASLEQVQAAQANVDALEAQKDAAQAQLDMLLAGATAAEIATAKATVAQAQDALDRAGLALSQAYLVAPFDGVISLIAVVPGEFIAPQMPVVILVDDGKFRIEAKVDEADIGWVGVGQEVQLELDAFPGRALAGHVIGIDTSATFDMGVVSYGVTIEIDESDLPLRGGMTVDSEIIIDQRENVLLIPNRAIWMDANTGKPFVEKEIDGAIVSIAIEQGLANDEFSEVLNGLEEGDQLIVRSASIRERFREMMTSTMGGQ